MREQTLYVLPVSKTSKSSAAANDRPMHVRVPELADTAYYPKKRRKKHGQIIKQQMHIKFMLSQKGNKIKSIGCAAFDIFTTV